MKRQVDIVRDAFVVVLSVCGGAFDAATYLRFHAFTANMTGNSVLFAIAAGGWHIADAIHNALAIGAFVAGAFAGSLVGRKASDDDPWPARVNAAFALEIVLVAGLAAGWADRPQSANAVILLALGALAMGVQSAITSDIYGGGASSTYMTGTLTRVGRHLADALRFGLRGGLALNVSSWAAYVAAAFATGAFVAAGRSVAPIFWAVAATLVIVMLVGRRVVMRAASGAGEAAA